MNSFSFAFQAAEIFHVQNTIHKMDFEKVHLRVTSFKKNHSRENGILLALPLELFRPNKFIAGELDWRQFSLDLQVNLSYFTG